MRAISFRINILFILLTIISLILIAEVNSADAFPGGNSGVTRIKHHGKTILLGQKALYVNAGLDKKRLGRYAFKTLQEAAAFAKDGTEQEPTVIYLEPDVYWTDDPAADNKENKLIGLKIPQANITLIGLSDNPDHTIIAGDRGQMAGSIGNWNTLGVGDGFHAYNITFGNYCNVDLVYPGDPSKNHTRRQKTITQAQVITKAHEGHMDKWLFENCKFISFLNVFARSDEPHRAYYSNCFFQCTDDAIGTGDLNVFKNCSFKFYSNHPSGSASNIIQVYLGCKFDAVLRDSGANSTIFFAKKNNVFAVIDGVFTGNVNRLEWTDHPIPEARHYVYNNTLRGKPVSISASMPALSVDLDFQSLRPFKAGGEYNIYNLLRGDDDWDPAGQRARLGSYANMAYCLKLTADKTQIKAETQETAIVSYTVYPVRVRTGTPVKWTVSDEKLLSIISNPNGTVAVSGYNTSEKTLTGYIKAETPGGIQSLIYIDVLARPLPAPTFTKQLSIEKPENGSISVDYSLDPDTRKDNSDITWYRATLPDGSDSIKVAVTRLNEPLKTYPLTTGDIGYYLVVKVEPKHQSSKVGDPVVVISKKIEAGDVIKRSIYTNFGNLPVQKSAVIRDGFWTLDTHRPVDLSDDFKWEPGEGNGWTYGQGYAGTIDRYGLMTTGRGARILYSQAGTYGDMSVTVNLSPHKASGQGFGSATGQYADIYIKFDAKTSTGYGLRIQRTPSFGEGVKFTLFKFVKGAGTPISRDLYSSVFLPGCTVRLRAAGNVLTAQVTTTGKQQQSQKDSGLVHEVNLSATIEKNTFGGFGVQHTGTVSSAGNRLMLESIFADYHD